MLQIGKLNQLTVVKELDFGIYLMVERFNIVNIRLIITLMQSKHWLDEQWIWDSMKVLI